MWSTLAAEVLELILEFTKSPLAVAAACRTCKSWSEISADSHLWRHIYYSMCAPISNESNINWKNKVADMTLIRKNIKGGRCVVRTYAKAERLQHCVTFEPEHYTFYKDICLLSWTHQENYGSYRDLRQLYSEFVNMVTEETTEDSDDYGPTRENFCAQRFDPSAIEEISFDMNDSVPFYLDDMTGRSTKTIESYFVDSKYVGFTEKRDGRNRKFLILNGETGATIYCHIKVADRSCLYDHILVLENEKEVCVIDVLTKKEIKKVFPAPVALGYVTEDTVVVRSENDVVLWNFKTNLEMRHPAGVMPLDPIILRYNDTWVMYNGGNLAFYSVQDGSLLCWVLLNRIYIGGHISLLSDGRIGVADWFGCRAISFMDSEVNRRIKLDLINIEGKVTTHEISASELSNFFVDKTKQPYEQMTSQIIEYSSPRAEDERFVMVFGQEAGQNCLPINPKATELLKSAKEPTHLHSPYQGWKVAAVMKNTGHALPLIKEVCGVALIVKEKKIDGRWQLV